MRKLSRRGSNLFRRQSSAFVYEVHTERKMELSAEQRAAFAELLDGVDEKPGLHERLSLHARLLVADEALERYRADPQAFDLLLVDLQMPKRSGRELLAQMREVDPDFEAIVITGHSYDGEAERAIAEGACCVVSKPYGLEELSAALERALSSRSSV